MMPHREANCLGGPAIHLGLEPNSSITATQVVDREPRGEALPPPCER